VCRQSFLIQFLAEHDLRVKAALMTLLLVCAGVALIRPPTKQVVDPLSGIWTGDWGPTPSHRNAVTVDLRWDGPTLVGSVNPGPHALRFTKTSFDVQTRAVHLEIETVSGGRELHYVITGVVEHDTLIGTWNSESAKGNFRLIRE
jgi:hypothetical protein